MIGRTPRRQATRRIFHQPVADELHSFDRARRMCAIGCGDVNLIAIRTMLISSDADLRPAVEPEEIMPPVIAKHIGKGDAAYFGVEPGASNVPTPHQSAEGDVIGDFTNTES